MPGSRPTAERIREALFSIWQDRVVGARFLELFCGSGAIGLEALSRGASTATLVDADGRALAVAGRNRDRLGASPAVCRTVKLAVAAPRSSKELGGEIFDLVFADPPYDFEGWVALLEAIDPLLAPGGEAVIEHSARGAGPPQRAASLERADARRYGDSALAFYRRALAGQG